MLSRAARLTTLLWVVFLAIAIALPAAAQDKAPPAEEGGDGDTRQLQFDKKDGDATDGDPAPKSEPAPAPEPKPETAPPANPSAHAGEPRTALVIGNGAYKVGELRNPPNDAHLVAETLKALGFEVLELLNGSLKEMKEATNEFGDKLKQKGGVGVFYYAGHGLQLFGRNYLVPVDAQIRSHEDVDVEAFDVNRVMAKLEMAGARVSVVILDACRNNPFNSMSPNFKLGLAAPRAPKGTLVAYATSPGNVAEDGTGQNSPFAESLAAAVRQPGVELAQVMKRVGAMVGKKTESRQTPWFTSSASEDFYFVTGSEPPKVGTVDPPSDDLLAPRTNSGPILAYVVGGLGLAVAGAGAVFGVMSLDANTQLQDRCPNPNACNETDLQTDRDNFALLANIGVGVGAAAVVTGTVLFFLHSNGTEPEWQKGVARRTRPARAASFLGDLRLDGGVTADGGALQLSGRF